MPQTCAKSSSTENAEASAVDVKPDTSMSQPAGGRAAALPSKVCGGAPSGASLTRVDLASGPAGAQDKWRRPDIKDTWCAVENMPRESWLRRRRKHWPDQSKSTVFLFRCNKVEAPPRCDWIVRKPRDERRHHFPGRSKASLSIL